MVISDLLLYEIFHSRGASSWLYIVPWGIRRNIRWVCERYGNMPLYITENGVSDHGEKDDQLRQDYFNSYVNEVLKGKKMIRKT